MFYAEISPAPQLKKFLESGPTLSFDRRADGRQLGQADRTLVFRSGEVAWREIYFNVAATYRSGLDRDYALRQKQPILKRQGWFAREQTAFGMGYAPGMSEEVNARSERVRNGLCADCFHARRIESAKGSVFILCELSSSDPTFPKYPRLPVVLCSGYSRKS